MSAGETKGKYQNVKTQTHVMLILATRGEVYPIPAPWRPVVSHHYPPGGVVVVVGCWRIKTLPPRL